MDWFEDERFWSTFDAYIFSAERMRGADEEVAQILSLTGVAGGAVLDQCCGPGRHAVAFASRGLRVTGVDRSAALLARARASALDRIVEVEFLQGDVREFARPGGFDLVVNLFTSFGYFDQEEDELRVLRNAHASLRPGGTFVVDVMGKEIVARVYQPTWSAPTDDGALVVARGEIVHDWTRVRNEWLAIRGGTVTRFAFEHWVYSGRELRDLLVRAGFASVRLFGDFSGRAYGPRASRLVAVAGKAGG